MQIGRLALSLGALALLAGNFAQSDDVGKSARRGTEDEVVETVAERLARLKNASEKEGTATPTPKPRYGRLRGGREHLRREYEDFDAEEKQGHLFNDTLERHEAHLETVARIEGHHSGMHAVSSAASRRSNDNTAHPHGLLGVDGGGQQSSEQPSGTEDEEEVTRLIDSQSNEYVLVRPHEGVEQMELQEDKALISDIMKVIVAAAIGGLLAGSLGQPVIIGYLVAGSVVGPGGFGIIEELVQVETLSQFGAVFLIFALGVEFSTVQLRQVWFVAAAAAAGSLFALGTAGLALASTLGAGWKPGLLVGLFVSMSSTAVVIKCLMEGGQLESRHGRVMLGILLLQDCMVGLFLAVMPALASSQAGTGIGALGWAAMMELLKLGVFLLAAWAISSAAMPCLLSTLQRLSSHSAELYQLAIIAECLGVAVASEHLGLSIEVGAFVGGLMLSSSSHSHRILQNIEPVRNLFAALFLSSIGLVLHPHFLWAHLELLLFSASVVIVAKVLVTGGLVLACGEHSPTAWLVATGLGQIGEFAFLLLSHAKHLKLLPKRLYLLTLGTTALTLLFTPLQWKAAFVLFGADRTLGSCRPQSYMSGNKTIRGLRSPEENVISNDTSWPAVQCIEDSAPLPLVAGAGVKSPAHLMLGEAVCSGGIVSSASFATTGSRPTAKQE